MHIRRKWVSQLLWIIPWRQVGALIYFVELLLIHLAIEMKKIVVFRVLQFWDRITE